MLNSGKPLTSVHPEIAFLAIVRNVKEKV